MLLGNLHMTPISGKNAKPSLFGFSVDQTRGFHVSLGVVTPADWYRRAKEALAKYDNLVVRTTRIGTKAERDMIQEWVGSPIVDGTPANAAQQVLTDIRQDVELYIPANVNAYEVPIRTERIQKLEQVNGNIEAMVTNAEAAHGILPTGESALPPVVVVQDSSSWLLPVVVGVGALGIAALVTYVYGGKA